LQVQKTDMKRRFQQRFGSQRKNNSCEMDIWKTEKGIIARRDEVTICMSTSSEFRWLGKMNENKNDIAFVTIFNRDPFINVESQTQPYTLRTMYMLHNLGCTQHKKKGILKELYRQWMEIGLWESKFPLIYVYTGVRIRIRMDPPILDPLDPDSGYLIWG